MQLTLFRSVRFVCLFGFFYLFFLLFLFKFVIVNYYGIILHKGSQKKQRPVSGYWEKTSYRLTEGHGR